VIGIIGSADTDFSDRHQKPDRCISNNNLVLVLKCLIKTQQQKHIRRRLHLPRCVRVFGRGGNQ